MKYDWLVVGAGFSGCVMAERIANELGQTVLLIDSRDHLGGNAYDYYNEDGLLIHKYGPHIFHTNSKVVWDYLSKFTDWRLYYHRVLAVIDGKKVPIPFNLDTIYDVLPPRMAERVEDELTERFAYGERVPILKLREQSGGTLPFLADYIYRKVFLEYTIKQWGVTPEEIDPSVTARVPVLISRDSRYFQDRYQAMPTEGYTEMFKRMVSNDKIEVRLNVAFEEIRDVVQYNRLIYTGPIDSFFGFRHGELPYRSLRFEFETHPVEWYQETGTVNYPNDYDFTRITEQKHLTGQSSDHTTIVIEYPQPYIRGENIPYYPVLNESSKRMLAKYREEMEKLGDQVLFLGRLADYKYYNMDQAVARALSIFESRLQGGA